MKKAKTAVKKTYKTCAECGSKILKSAGSMSKGKFLCAGCSK
jgi:formylmethanofuran dehydrogenase subunit E